MNPPSPAPEPRTAKDLLDWAESIICNAGSLTDCTQAEVDDIVKKWRDEKHVLFPDGVQAAPTLADAAARAEYLANEILGKYRVSVEDGTNPETLTAIILRHLSGHQQAAGVDRPNFAPVAQKFPITSPEGASADSGPKGTPAQAGEVEQHVSNVEVAGSSPARGSLSLPSPREAIERAILMAWRGWFLQRTSGENCMNTLVDVFTGMREQLEDDAEMLPMIRALLTPHLAPSTPSAGEQHKARLLAVARGCHDYNGGRRGAEAEAFHHGIDTVINALTAAAKNDPNDTQVNALERMGRAALAQAQKTEWEK